MEDQQKYILMHEMPDKSRLMLLSPGEKGLNFNEGYYEVDKLKEAGFGEKVFSKNKKSWCHLLPVSPFLYTEHLLHKTQILYAPDIANIILKLDIRPGLVVVESGTGSGSLSVNFAQRLVPKGKLYTYEFNQSRAEKAKVEFERLGLEKCIQVTHRDVLAKGFEIEGTQIEADAVFLDLPNPQQAIPHARKVLKYYGKLCNFSPCIEQVQEVCKALKQNGFGEIETMECLNKEYGELNHAYQKLDQVFKKKRTSTKDQKYLIQSSPVPVSQVPPQRVNNYINPVAKMRGHTGYLTFACKYFDTEDQLPNL